MLHRNKIKLLTTSILAVCALSGCSSWHTFTEDYLGVTRTMPRTSSFESGSQRTPRLNPDAAGIMAPDPNASENWTNSDGQPQASNALVAPTTAVAASDNGYPYLASVPPKPVATPRAQTVAAYKDMTAQQRVAEAQRQNLMGNGTATVMTSPQTGQMVTDPAQAGAAAAATAPVAAAPAPIAAAPRASSASSQEFQIASNAPMPSAAPAYPALTSPPEGMAPAPAQASGYSLSSAPEAEAPAVEPIHLHEPAALSGKSAPIPSYIPPYAPTASVPNMPNLPTGDLARMSPAAGSATEMAAQDPVHLTSPHSGGATQHYLPDSRYAGKRDQAYQDETDR